MSGKSGSRDADFEEANMQLIAGLKSCRSVVENYRAMLSPGPNERVADNDAGDAESDQGLP